MGINGIYLAYFTGEYGTSLGIFLLKDGIITGGDLGGGKYDGDYVEQDGRVVGTINFRTSEAGYGITGAQNDLPVSYETALSLSTPIEEAPFHAIETMSGPVNVRFEKIRGL